MKIGAFQFGVTGDILHNMEQIKTAVLRAANENVRLLIFPECALTGYPPHDMKASSSVDFMLLEKCCKQLQVLADTYNMYLVVGMITKEQAHYFNSAVIFSPLANETAIYHKRSLWGWDKDNFCAGQTNTFFTINGFKIGIRICFDIRFPELFRELYRAQTDLNLILFYDISTNNDIDSYNLIKSHLCTRAAENVCYTLSVNTILPFQTAPTALFNRSGRVLTELERNTTNLLVYDLEKTELSFGELGRKTLSDAFL